MLNLSKFRRLNLSAVAAGVEPAGVRRSTGRKCADGVKQRGTWESIEMEVVMGELCVRAELCALRAGFCAPGSDFGEVVTGELCAWSELCAPSCDAV